MILLYLLIIMNKSSLLSIEELIFNLDSLNKNSIPNWGKMNSSQMMKHCSRFIDLYKGEIKLPFWYKIFGVTVGKLFLFYFSKKSPLKTPRNLKTLNSIKICEENLDFEYEKRILTEKLQDLSNIKQDIIHPIYGKMDSEKTKFLIIHHTIHHYNQFGLT